MNLPPRKQTRFEGGERGFTLVELLSVVAIMAIVMGVLAMSLSQSQGRGVQMAAAQVASGLNLTRQLAVNMNSPARLIISRTTSPAAGSILPSEPYQYWAVVYSNKQKNNWILARDWERLAPGTVFMNVLGSGYSPLAWQKVGASPGQAYTPDFNASPPAAVRWRTFGRFADFRIALPADPDAAVQTIAEMPFVGFNADGGAFGGLTGVGIAEGSVTADGQIILRSTNNVIYVEVDPILGKATVRPRESYDREN